MSLGLPHGQRVRHPTLHEGKAPRADGIDMSYHALDARLKAAVGEKTEEVRRREEKTGREGEGKSREKEGRERKEEKWGKITERAGRLPGRVSSLPITMVTSYICSMSLESTGYEAEERRCVDSQVPGLPGNTHQNKTSSDEAMP